jgi:beta-lactamase class A
LHADLASILRVRVALLLILTACGVEAPPGGDSDSHGWDVPGTGTHAGEWLPTGPDLGDAVAWLDAETATRSPGTQLSITIEDLDTGAIFELRGDEKHVSASSAKAWWVAAALDEVGIAPVEPYAGNIFRYSDNSASGSVIDLIGPNAVNTWMWNVAGMNDSALTQWSYDKTRIATNSPRALGSDNYMTSNDAVRFLSRVYDKQILAGEPGDQLLEWMTLSPNTGLGGWIPARLPDDVAMTAMHKAGWLPPGCCSDDSYYNTSNDIGIVKTADGRAFAIAILARRGTDYAAQTSLVELSSCMFFRAFTQDEQLACE